ncbi:hypothetical protein BFJ70_g3706 [Fusarium oxysporum]|nr:uncharacterized protein FOBCDRAFT_202855 [Fusarium oxysporum Fo47]EWZ39307.1 hypothetical protein FOZG_08443 [Fusarium oxysporum Fo47]QKD55742.1 hypothetical protein FOBCDRAFT_202855 [Fusarium oxysporum Fo47]RKL44564.1 hypothetical protein BFJ70_g3706 [Fusarium oxysporum]
MAPIGTRKQVRFKDQYERPKNKAPLTEMRKPDGITILTKKDEVCRFITGALSHFLKPIEIPPNTHLIEHRPWSAGGIYTIRSVEPILPNTRVSLPPVQWIEVRNMELSLNNGMKVCVQIEDSIHGPLLASYLKKLDLLELQANGTTDSEMESPQ